MGHGKLNTFLIVAVKVTSQDFKEMITITNLFSIYRLHCVFHHGNSLLLLLLMKVSPGLSTRVVFSELRCTVLPRVGCRISRESIMKRFLHVFINPGNTEL